MIKLVRRCFQHIYTDNNGELMTLMQREMADDNRHFAAWKPLSITYRANP
ncbi:hypothetical protein ACNKHR_28930 [Shigella flexneri]